MVLGFSNVGKKVTGRVWVNPAPGKPQPTGNVTVILQQSNRWAGGAWKYVNRRVIPVPPNFEVRFAEPKNAKACRFIARYDGDDNYYAAKIVRWFTC